MPKYAANEVVRVVGIDDLVQALRAMGPQWPKELGKANQEAASTVVSGAQTIAAQLGGVARKAARSLKAAAAARESKVTLGGPAYPFALGAEFGAKAWLQFEDWRGNQWEPDTDAGVGYFLHPAIRNLRRTGEYETVYLAAIDRVVARAFPDTV